MKSIFIFTVILFFVSLNCFNLDSKSKLYEAMNTQLNALREAPANYEKYITDLTTQSDFFFGSISNENELLQIQQQYGFSTGILNTMKSILANKNKDKIEVISEQNLTDKNSLTEFLGVAVYDADGKVYYVIIRAKTTGRVLKQMEIKTNTVCKKKRFHKRHCWDEQYEVERANNQEEIDGMRKTVLSKSLLGIRSKFYEEKEKLQKEINTKKEQESMSGSSQGGQVQDALQAKKAIFIQNLQRLVDSSRVKPQNYEQLVRNIRSYSDVNMDMFNKNEVDNICQKYSLPDDVKQKLRAIAFLSQAIATEDIKYLCDKNQASVEEILGFVMKEGDTVFFSFIRSVTEGEIPYRVKNVDVKICHKVALVAKSCHHESRTVDDPYTAQELQTVKQAILAISSETLKNKLMTIIESQTLLGANGKIVSPDGSISAIMNKDGRIFVGPSSNPLSGTLYTIGTSQTESYAPYSLQVKENGNLYIINKNNDKVWSSNTANQGVPPFILSLGNNGDLDLIDSNNKIIFKGKK